MESFIVLSMYLKGNVITDIFKNLEPFININQEDGIYYYRIMIILKMLFTLRIADTALPNYITHVVFAISNAYVASVHKDLAILSAIAQCLLLFAPTKKSALFVSMAWMCILSMSLKPYEFTLDVCVCLSMLWYAFEAYPREFQKLCTIISLEICLGWYICNLQTFSFYKFFLIIGFLLLAYIPLKPNWNTKHRDRLLFFYGLMFVWIVYHFQIVSYCEAQTSDFNVENIGDLNKKWGQSGLVQRNKSAISENMLKVSSIENLQAGRQTKILSHVFNTKPLDKWLMNNVTLSNEVLTNVYTAGEDSNDEMCPVNSSNLIESNFVESTTDEKIDLTAKSEGGVKEVREMVHGVAKPDYELKVMKSSRETDEVEKNSAENQIMKDIPTSDKSKSMQVAEEKREIGGISKPDYETKVVQSSEETDEAENQKMNDFPTSDKSKSIQIAEQEKEINEISKPDNEFKVMKSNGETEEVEKSNAENKVTKEIPTSHKSKSTEIVEEERDINKISKSDYELKVLQSGGETDKVDKNNVNKDQIMKDISTSDKSKSIQIAEKEREIDEISNPNYEFKGMKSNEETEEVEKNSAENQIMKDVSTSDKSKSIQVAEGKTEISEISKPDYKSKVMKSGGETDKVEKNNVENKIKDIPASDISKSIQIAEEEREINEISKPDYEFKGMKSNEETEEVEKNNAENRIMKDIPTSDKSESIQIAEVEREINEISNQDYEFRVMKSGGDADKVEQNNAEKQIMKDISTSDKSKSIQVAEQEREISEIPKLDYGSKVMKSGGETDIVEQNNAENRIMKDIPMSDKSKSTEIVEEEREINEISKPDYEFKVMKSSGETDKVEKNNIKDQIKKDILTADKSKSTQVKEKREISEISMQDYEFKEMKSDGETHEVEKNNAENQIMKDIATSDKSKSVQDAEEKREINEISEPDYESKVMQSSEKTDKVVKNDVENQIMKAIPTSDKSKSTQIVEEKREISEKIMHEVSVLGKESTSIANCKDMDIQKSTDDEEMKLMKHTLQDMSKPNHQSSKLMDSIADTYKDGDNNLKERLIEDSCTSDEYQLAENEMKITERKGKEIMQQVSIPDNCKSLKSVEEAGVVVEQKNVQGKEMESFSTLNEQFESRNTGEKDSVAEGEESTNEDLSFTFSFLMEASFGKQDTSDIMQNIYKQIEETEKESDNSDEVEEQRNVGSRIIEDISMVDEEFISSESGKKHLRIEVNRQVEREPMPDLSNEQNYKSVESVEEIDLTVQLESCTEDETIQNVLDMQEGSKLKEIVEKERNAKEESMQYLSSIAQKSKSMETVERNTDEESIQEGTDIREKSKWVKIVKRKGNVEEILMQGGSNMQEESKSMENVDWEKNAEGESMKDGSNMQECKSMENVDWEKNAEDESNMQECKSMENAYGEKNLEDEAMQDESNIKEESRSMENVDWGKNVEDESMQDVSKSMETIECERNLEEKPVQVVSNMQESKFMETVEWKTNAEGQMQDMPSTQRKSKKTFEGTNLMEEANKMDAIEYMEKNKLADIKSIEGDEMYVINENEEMYNDEEYMTDKDDLKMAETDETITIESDGNKQMYLLINREGRYYIL